MTLEKEAVPVTTKFLQGYYDSPQISRVDVGQGYLVAAGDDADKAKLYAERELVFRQPWKPISGTSALTGLTPVVGAGKTAAERERNRKLRQAISIAVDWEEQIAIFEKGQGEAAHGPLPPGLSVTAQTGLRPLTRLSTVRTVRRIVRRSIEDARRLMREAGYLTGAT